MDARSSAFELDGFSSPFVANKMLQRSETCHKLRVFCDVLILTHVCLAVNTKPLITQSTTEERGRARFEIARAQPALLRIREVQFKIYISKTADDARFLA